MEPNGSGRCMAIAIPLLSDLVCGETIDPLATEPHAAVRRAL